MIIAKRFAILEPYELAGKEFHTMEGVSYLAIVTGKIIKYDDTHCNQTGFLDNLGNPIN